MLYLNLHLITLVTLWSSTQAYDFHQKENYTWTLSCISRLIERLFVVGETIYTVSENPDEDHVVHTLRNPLISVGPFRQTFPTRENYATNWMIQADSAKSVIEIMDWIVASTFWNSTLSPRGQFVIVLPISNNLTEIFMNLWRCGILNAVVAIRNLGAVEFYTCNPHHGNNCGRTATNFQTERCTVEELRVTFQRDLRSFYDCPAYYVVENVRLHKQTRKGCVGTRCHTGMLVLKTLSEKFNLRIVPVLDRYYIVNNSDLVIRSKVQKLKNYLDESLIIETQKAFFVVPPPLKVPLIEMLGFIFKTETWFLILVFLIFKIVLWWFSLLSINPNNRGIKLLEAFTDVVAILLGGAINRVVKKNLLKWLLIIFLFYCIHIQIAFTSNLFNLLTIEKYESVIKNIEDLADSDLPICTTDLFRQEMDNEISENSTFAKLVRKMRYYPIDSKPYPHERAIYRRECAALLAGIDFYYIQYRYNLTMDEIEDTAVMRQLDSVFTMRKGHYFMRTLNSIITRLKEAGIYQVVETNTYLDLVNIIRKIHADVVALNLEHLYVFFIIFGAGCCISVVVFILEIIAAKLP